MNAQNSLVYVTITVTTLKDPTNAPAKKDLLSHMEISVRRVGSQTQKPYWFKNPHHWVKGQTISNDFQVRKCNIRVFSKWVGAP